MRSELSSRSESSVTQGEVLKEDLVNNPQQQQLLQDRKIGNLNNNKIEDLIHENVNLKTKQPSKDSDSTSPESDYLNFDTGDSEEKQFSRFFTPIKILGSGAFGKVVQAREVKTGQEYAVKIIAKNNVSQGEIDKLRKEARILSQLDHKNIVRFDRVLESETRIFIVMELLLGGTLRQLMSERKKSKQHFSEQEAALIMNNIINGVAYFHAKSIVHRDLKPDNILIGDKNDLNTVKIADFGLSAAFEAKKSISFTQQCGTLIYMAPEFFIQKTYSKPIDIWSCAIIMYQLLSHGTHPLYDPKVDDNKSFKKKIQTSPQIKFPPTFSDITKSLIQKMTILDPSARYTANQVTSHPWITQKLEDDIPLTMNEMLSTVNKQTNFSNMQKALCFILYMKMQQSNSQSLVSSKYKEKCKRFSQKKRRESNVNKKVDIYSQNYLNSIIDLDQSKRISSFISDDLSEDAKSQSNNEDEEESMIFKNETLLKLPSDNQSSQQDGSSPYQRGSLTSTYINQIPTFNKLDQASQKSASPLLKKISHRKQLSASIQKSNNANKNGTMNIVAPFQQNGQGVNQFNAIQSSNTLQAIPLDKQQSQKPNHTNGITNINIQQRRSTSLHKTNTQHLLEPKHNDFILHQNHQYVANQESYNKLEKDFIIEKIQTKGDKFPKKMSSDSKDTEGNSPGFNIKVYNRDELNNQISRKERINTQNSITIDQQRSVSPRKKNSQMLTIRRDNSRRGQDQNPSVSPVKVPNSASPYKNYNFLKTASRNPSMNDEILEQQPQQQIQNITNQNSANSTLSNTITTQRTYTKQSVGYPNDSPEQFRRTSQLKNYSEIPEGQKIIHLQKAQMTLKLQQGIPQNSASHVYTNQSSHTIQSQTQNLNNTFKIIVDNKNNNARQKNISPPHHNQNSIITNSVNNQIQNFAKLSSTQQPPKETFPTIQKGLHQVIPINMKGSNQSSTIRERQNRAISQDQKSAIIRGNQQSLNQSMMMHENSKQSNNQSVIQNNNHLPLNENSTRIHVMKEVDLFNANNAKRMIQNINANKIMINQRPLTKK